MIQQNHPLNFLLYGFISLQGAHHFVDIYIKCSLLFNDIKESRYVFTIFLRFVSVNGDNESYAIGN